MGLAMTLIFSCPLFMVPLRDTITGMVWGPAKAVKFSWIRHIMLTVGILGLAYLFAVFVPDVADVLSLAGATCATAVMYLFPAAFYLALDRQNAADDPYALRRRYGAIAVLVWGSVMAISGTVVSCIEFAD